MSDLPEQPPAVRPRLPRGGSARPVAAIDIGSNSVFLMVVHPSARPMLVLDRRKWAARLGDSVARTGQIEGDLVNTLVRTIDEFRKVAESWDAELVGVATAALRRASNGGAVLQRIAADTGVQVELLSGEDEAALAFLGARFGGAGDGQPMLCADVGGGSTDVSVGDGDEAQMSVSLPVGAVTLSREHFPDEQVSDAQLQACRSRLQALFRPALSRMRGGDRVAVGTSGTITRVARITTGSMEVDGATVTAAQLEELVARLAAAGSHDERRAMPGMDPARADVLLAGALIFAELSAALDVDTWYVSVAGLRAGIVANSLAKRSESCRSDGRQS